MRLEGSLHNRIMESSKQPEPEVGMPATRILYTDRVPCVVTEIVRHKNGKIRGVMIADVQWTREPWPSGYAKEIHLDRPTGPTEYIRRKRNGTYPGLLLGRALAYEDPHF